MGTTNSPLSSFAAKQSNRLKQAKLFVWHWIASLALAMTEAESDAEFFTVVPANAGAQNPPGWLFGPRGVP